MERSVCSTYEDIVRHARRNFVKRSEVGVVKIRCVVERRCQTPVIETYLELMSAHDRRNIVHDIYLRLLHVPAATQA
jgi:hypothetical protein